MKYFKIIHEPTETIMCYVASKDNADDICVLFGEDYIAVEITKEEYERATGEEKGGAEE